MNIITKILIGSAVLGLASCQNENENIVASTEVIPVTLATVSAPSQAGFIAASGQIESVNGANISTMMMGYVEEVLVKTGDVVDAGQPLLRVSSEALLAKQAQVEANIAQAKTAFESARRDLERFTNLHAKGSATDRELENMESQFEMRGAQLDAANEMNREVEAQWAYLHIRAPFSGRVAGVYTKMGEMANPGMPLMRLESEGAMEVKVMVDESSIGVVQLGLPVAVYLKATGQEVPGTVSEVSHSSTGTGGQYIVKISLPISSGLKAGMFVHARIKTTKPIENSPILIPAEALVIKGQLTGIYTLGYDDKALLRWLRVGRNMGQEVEVFAGLSAGESYIAQSEAKLYDGVKVSY